MPDGKRPKRSARTYKQAREKLRGLEKQREANVKPFGKMTVEGYMTEWQTNSLPARQSRGRCISERTVRSYSDVIRLHIVPSLGKKHLEQITPLDVEAMLLMMASGGLSRSLVSRARQILSMALDRAVRHGQLVANVARLAEIPTTQERTVKKALTVEQARLLMGHMDGHRYKAAWIIQLQLGLRPGEVLGLIWEDIDFDAGLLFVRRALIELGTTRYLGEVKTPKSVRALTMPPAVIDALRERQLDEKRERQGAGALWAELNLVFPTSVGSLTGTGFYRRSLQSVAKAAGLSDTWTPNELRHTCVSLLADAGVPLQHVADLMGHASTRMTSEVYRHKTSPTVDVAVLPMNELFGSGSNSGSNAPLNDTEQVSTGLTD